jgi:Na+-transporting NADH:ubiquinone oxidoreductase subunit B
MKFFIKILEAQGKHFEHGGKLEKFHPLYEAIDTFIFTLNKRTDGATHVRDAVDLKRVMTVVVLALMPCILLAIYNHGYLAQQFLVDNGGQAPGWVGVILALVGLQAGSFGAVVLHGLLLFLPLYIVTMTVGGILEVIFAIVRKHEINEGFLVTGLLFPLILPPSIPLWQVALGISFGVVIGKEVFGGTGYNVLNPALVGRAFLFFAYPAQISGNAVWVAVDGYTAATPLAEFAAMGKEQFSQFLDHGLQSGITWLDAFLGFVPGSFAETSTLACLFGAIILVATGVANWRIMVSSFLGMFFVATLFNVLGSDTNPAFGLGFHWHLVLGGFAFGTVFMATDPVSAAQTDVGRWIYGAMIGALIVLVRVVNPAYPEGTMLAILFGNILAPIIDYFVVKKNIKRREARLAVQ